MSMYTLANLRLDEMGGLLLQIDMHFDNRKNMAYAVQMMLCRTILNQYNNICVSPGEDFAQIILIGEAAVIEQPSDEFKAFLRSQRIKISAKLSVDCDMIVQSLRFSLFYWLESKLWYRVGECVMPRKLLTIRHSSLQFRIDPRLNVTSEGEVLLSPRCEVVRVVPFEMWQLDDEFGPAKEGPVAARNVNVLPRLGRGRVVAFYRSLPKHSPFSSYAQLKIYWKNTYGYELPNEEPPAYLDVIFYGMKESFCYPSYCVLTAPPEEVPYRREDEMTRSALGRFVTDLSSCDVELCGHKLQVSEATKKTRFDLTAALLDVPPIHPNKLKKNGIVPKFAFKQKLQPMTNLMDKYLTPTKQNPTGQSEETEEEEKDVDVDVKSVKCFKPNLAISQFSQTRNNLDVSYAEASRMSQLGVVASPSSPSFNNSTGFGAGTVQQIPPKFKPMFASEKSLAAVRALFKSKEHPNSTKTIAALPMKSVFLMQPMQAKTNALNGTAMLTPERKGNQVRLNCNDCQRNEHLD
ncbi:hypothetical protein WR25_14612 isoform E [Diploscapter pachys]|uniref:DUF4708 domain-containing protein n=1 Tax=Diploscapter pachys TaxID=2018661 RepID=A0A2A2LWA1_9BILA|nr:hypothetical protein WR25_14612 isoform C [Diploscapter pachys]PAV90481.1 hypothetical protein WR25_14612 isoform E [Diploscapter pachys]